MCHGMILRFTKQSAEQTRKDGDLPISKEILTQLD